MTETTAPVQSLHDQIMRLPCTPPKDANVNQMLAYKSGHRDARHAAAELAAGHEADARQAAQVAAQEPQKPADAILDDMRRRGLSINGDNQYKRDILDCVVGALAFGKQGSAPPPANHWLHQFWEIGDAERKERDAARQAAHEALAWISVDERLPEPGYWLVTVDTDEGSETHILELNRKGQWMHEGEPTFCHGYHFRPVLWAERPQPGAIPENQDDE